MTKGLKKDGKRKKLLLKKAKEEMAKMMFSKGIDMDTIVDVTGLPKQEIEKFI
jgi:hypothetical protein